MKFQTSKTMLLDLQQLLIFLVPLAAAVHTYFGRLAACNQLRRLASYNSTLGTEFVTSSDMTLLIAGCVLEQALDAI